MTVIEEGQIVADLRTSFSAMDMTDPEVFPSLLFYYGMRQPRRLSSCGP